MEHAECNRERLAEATGLRVELCRCCRCVHLTIGAVTVRVQAEVVAALARVLCTAEVELLRRELGRPRAWAEGLPS